MNNTKRAAKVAASPCKRVQNLIMEIEKHLQNLETIALNRDLDGIDNYMRYNEFVGIIGVGSIDDTPCAIMNLIKVCSIGEHITISTQDNSMCAVVDSEIVYQKALSSNLSEVINIAGCRSIVYDFEAPEIRRTRAKNYLRKLNVQL